MQRGGEASLVHMITVSRGYGLLGWVQLLQQIGAAT